MISGLKLPSASLMPMRAQPELGERYHHDLISSSDVRLSLNLSSRLAPGFASLSLTSAMLVDHLNKIGERGLLPCRQRRRKREMREQHGDRVLDPAKLPAVAAISTFDIQDSRLAAAATVANATGDNGACRGHGRPACCAERGASGAVRGRLCYLLAVLLLAVPPAGATERLRLSYVAGPDHAAFARSLGRW